jgi:hypothetical protein
MRLIAPVYECFKTWHAKGPGEVSGIWAFFCICILHYPQESKMINTLQEGTLSGYTVWLQIQGSPVLFLYSILKGTHRGPVLWHFMYCIFENLTFTLAR